jgi:hypothetical protein
VGSLFFSDNNSELAYSSIQIYSPIRETLS